MEIAGLVLSLIGVIPILATVWYRVQRYRRAQRVFGLARDAPVDIVLTTSDVKISDVGVRVERPLSGYGQITGVAEFSRAIALHYGKKQLRIHLSGYISNRIEHDLVCLGGPAKNESCKTAFRP